ncbi:hypothetical protein G9F72_021150 [Clostridium estertheticum]|uniref:hypothetical protein n=1 Tax=Clostridium estertheticum TaxID=238834 RepID=UPI001CD19390|nr:hypothetical protein [Clostridium estertheticum]MBZ9688832.1 hypothetical protein [Clostridium estertheticum]
MVMMMTMVGKIIYGAGKLVGNTAEHSIEVTGNVISAIAEKSGSKKLAVSTKKYSTIASKMVGKTTKITAAITAVVADTTIIATINTAKYIAENAVQTNIRIYGETERFYDEDKYIEVEYKALEK